MPGIESNAVEPTKDELRGLSPVQKALRLAPTYGLVILMVGLILLFSVLLPNTFPTLLNLRSILSRQGDHRAAVAGGDDPDGGGAHRPDRRLRHRAVAHPGDQPADDVRPALAGGGRHRADPWRHHRGAERPCWSRWRGSTASSPRWAPAPCSTRWPCGTPAGGRWSGTLPDAFYAINGTFVFGLPITAYLRAGDHPGPLGHPRIHADRPLPLRHRRQPARGRAERHSDPQVRDRRLRRLGRC